MPEIFDSEELKKSKTPPKFSSHPPSDHSDPNKTPKTRHVDDYSDIIRQEKPTKNPLHAFAPKPTNTSFDSQLKDEKIVLLMRQHPITQLKPAAIAVVLILLPWLFSKLPLIELFPARFAVAGLIGWYLLVLGFIFEAFLIWFFNVYIITDERIIDVDFLSLVYKNISSAKIEKVEDITTTTGGVLASIVDYGTINIQTAAERREFEFDHVPHPGKVAALINELVVEEEREKIEGRVS